jgi:hypothetical protein
MSLSSDCLMHGGTRLTLSTNGVSNGSGLADRSPRPVQALVRRQGGEAGNNRVERESNHGGILADGKGKELSSDRGKVPIGTANRLGISFYFCNLRLKPDPAHQTSSGICTNYTLANPASMNFGRHPPFAGGAFVPRPYPWINRQPPRMRSNTGSGSFLSRNVRLIQTGNHSSKWIAGRHQLG